MQFLRRKSVTVVLLLAFLWLSHGLYQVDSRRESVQVQVSDLQSKISGMERENEFLASASAYFESDSYLERQARVKLNYKLPDEEVAFIYKDTESEEISSEKVFRDRLAQMPNWKKWWYYVLGY